MGWPAEETPTSGGVWLECNGQSIPSQYKRLRELVGDKTPNYQGMFLRGYGAQQKTVRMGYLHGDMTFTYKSGALNEVQTVGMIPFQCNGWPVPVLDDENFGWLQSTYSGGVADGGSHWDGGWYPDHWGYWENGIFYPNPAGYQLPPDQKEKIWILNRPPAKVVEDSKGNSHEEPDYDSGHYQGLWTADHHFWVEASIPPATEPRPINVAIRYFIKAR